MPVPEPSFNERAAESQQFSPFQTTMSPATHQTQTDIAAEQEGPFCSLVHQACDSQFGQRIKSQFPKAGDTLSSLHGMSAKADNVVRKTQEVMATREGRRLSAATAEFVMSLVAFANMILAMGLNEIANYLDIGIEESPKTSSTLSYQVLSKVGVKICEKAASHENQVRGTSLEKMFVYGRLVGTFLFNAFMCGLSGMLRFDGCGKEYVVPIAEKVVGLMPRSLEASVKETDGPMRVIKKWMESRNDSGAKAGKAE